jgi:DNA-binding NarL/FixJ family response regulator
MTREPLLLYAAQLASQRLSHTAHHDLRLRALLAAARASDELSLARLWDELALGRCRVVEAFFTDSKCFLVTAPCAEPAAPLTGRRRAVLQRVLSGAGQKEVADELGVATSTVSLDAQQGLRQLGLSCRPSRSHPLLMLAAKAAVTNDARAASLSFIETSDGRLRVLSIDRPELPLHPILGPAERAVVASLVEGDQHSEIAKRRGTSPRTVANQIGAIFRRMNVSGRSELLNSLFTEHVR